MYWEDSYEWEEGGEAWTGWDGTDGQGGGNFNDRGF